MFQNKLRFWMDLGRLLERFWMDCGLKLRGKLKPSWQQNLKTDGSKTISKTTLKTIWRVFSKSNNNKNKKCGVCNRRLGSGEYEGNPQGSCRFLYKIQHARHPCKQGAPDIYSKKPAASHHRPSPLATCGWICKPGCGLRNRFKNQTS